MAMNGVVCMCGVMRRVWYVRGGVWTAVCHAVGHVMMWLQYAVTVAMFRV